MSAMVEPWSSSGPLLRAMIVDDEPLCRRRVQEMIDHHEDVHVVAECRDAAEALQTMAAARPDVLFLDVEMPRGSGFELLAALDPHDRPAVIFVTAHGSYAVEAFSVRAVDYLVKPFTAARFADSLDRAREFVRRRNPRQHPSPNAYAATRVAIRTAAGVTFLRSEDVSWLEAAGNYVRVHAGKETHLVRDTMNRLESTLDPSRFARIHRSTIVNVDRIVQAIPAFGRAFVIVLKDGARLKLAAHYRPNLQRLGFAL